MRRALIRWLARAYATVDRRARLLVLTLHRVGGTSRIIPEHFERDFAFLAERYETILPGMLESRRERHRLAMVTINDGLSVGAGLQ